MAVEYRIVRDIYSGYEVQWKPTWFPIWLRRVNTHPSVERAEQWAMARASAVVKHLGVIGPSPVTQPGEPNANA